MREAGSADNSLISSANLSACCCNSPALLFQQLLSFCRQFIQQSGFRCATHVRIVASNKPPYKLRQPPSSRRRCSRWFQRPRAECGRRMGKPEVQRLKSKVRGRREREFMALRCPPALGARACSHATEPSFVEAEYIPRSSNTGHPFLRGGGGVILLKNKLRVAASLRLKLWRLLPWWKQGEHFVVPSHGLLECLAVAVRQHPAPVGKFQSRRIAEDAIICRRRHVAAFHRFRRCHV